MRYQVFKEFDAYQDAFQHAQVRMTLHRRDRQDWTIGQMHLGPIHLQWGTSGGGMVSEGEVHPGGHALFIPLSNTTTNGVNGVRLSEASIMVAASGAEFCVSADAWNDWCSLFIPYDAAPGDLSDTRREPLSGCQVVALGSRHLGQVRREIRKLTRLAAASSEPPNAHESSLRLLQPFVESAIRQASPNMHADIGRPRLNRDEIVRLVQDRLKLKSDRKFEVGELADAADVSERTLLRIFHDWYGISPKRYARLRKIHAVRDARLAADPNSSTVTTVLTRHNVNHFGRFAGVYHSLFGELPSETLARGNS